MKNAELEHLFHALYSLTLIKTLFNKPEKSGNYTCDWKSLIFNKLNEYVNRA